MKTLKKTSLPRIILFLAFYIIFYSVLSTVFGILLVLLVVLAGAFISQINSGNAILILLGIIDILLIPLISYLLAEATTLLGKELFKFTWVERFIATILIPGVFFILFGGLIYLTYTTQSFAENTDPFGIILSIYLIIATLATQCFTFVFGEIIIFIARKVRSSKIRFRLA